MNINEILGGALDSISLDGVISALLLLLVCLVAIRILMKLFKRVLSRTKLDERMQKLTLTAIKTVLYILTFILVSSRLVDTTSLVALLSVGSLGITLAAEDILGNMAGGLVIMSGHPFNIGDYISVSGVDGTVTEITLNYTKLTSPDGQLIMLPNKTVADSQMVNYTASGKRRIVLTVSASYGDSTEAVKTACMEALDKTPYLLADPAPAVYVTNYGDSAVEYTLYCWVQPADFLTAKFTLSEQVRAAFAAHGVSMTYNHLNIHIVENGR